MTADPNNELTIIRVLDAPRETVWRAMREVEALRQWWGMPNGAVMPFCEVDFRVGGTLHFGTERGGRPRIWFICRYREIVEGERLVMEQHRSDESGRELDSPEWPASTIALRLEDVDSKTRLTVVHSGMASGRATVDDYRQGWSETLDRLAGVLVES
jgi:uncharacterized protein YndB with AHSA1/START domain